LLDILRFFKVPVGLSAQEQQTFKDYFDKHNTQGKSGWFKKSNKG
jgi:hypothetical protein